MMAQNDPVFFAKALHRVRILILAIGLLGALALSTWNGVRFGGGFLVGTAISFLSFWRWEKVAESISSTPTTTPKSTMRLALRILAIMAAAYVIIKYSGVTPAAVVVGLLVPAAAATFEIIYELIYGT